MSRLKFLLCAIVSFLLLANPAFASTHSTKHVTKHQTKRVVTKKKFQHSTAKHAALKHKQAHAKQTNHSVATVGHVHHGHASWYGPGLHGRRTASGERFDKNALTCAHRTLPFGSIVKVTNMRTQKSVNLRVTDRGPYSNKYCIDVSYKAAEHLGMLGRGNDQVKLEVVDLPSTKKNKPTFVESSQK